MVCKILHPHKYVKPSEVAIYLFLFGMSYLCGGSFLAISFPLGKYCQLPILCFKFKIVYGVKGVFISVVALENCGNCYRGVILL